MSRPAIEIGLPPVADGLNATVGDPSITLPATRSEVTAPRTITPVKSLWTEHSQTVANPDGSFSLVTAAGNKLTMVADPRFDQPASGNGNDLRHSRLGK